MGATVVLMGRYERVLFRAITNERGIFGFGSLSPDVYAVKVSLTSFVPALKQKIVVQPGIQSLLYINMASVLSSVELVYAAEGKGPLMSDDWKWTLRSVPETRPVLRLSPAKSTSPKTKPAPAFSDTRAIVSLSAGDSGSLGGSSAEPDLGTAFAVTTSLYGRNQLQLSGNVGSSWAGFPTAGMRTSYRHEGAGPEISLTIRQLYLASPTGNDLSPGALPGLRTMSIAMLDRVEILSNLRLEYGLSLDSVSFLDHINYLSPFGRLTYDLGEVGSFQAAFSSGAPPAELFAHKGDAEVELHQDLAALAVLPRVSLRGSRSRVQRVQNAEIGYQKRFGSRAISLSGFHESVSNGALSMSTADNLFAAGDVLPDISSRSSIVNIGGYQRYGYAAAVTQNLGDHVTAGFSFGRAGALTASRAGGDIDSAGDLRQAVHISQNYWASTHVSTTLPGTGTEITGSYRWTDPNVVMPDHLFLTQRGYSDTGLTFIVRQPVPVLRGIFPGRLEANASLQNLLAQGYLPLLVNGNRRTFLTQSPRAIRGGLSFIF